MCDPVTAVAMGLTVASSIYGVDQQRRNANDQERAYRRAQEVQEQEINAQKGVQATQRAAQARAERARLRAASAETGLAGLSFSDLIDNVSFQEGTDLANIARNNTSAVNSSRAELGSRLAGIQQPDYIGTALNTGLQVYAIGDSSNMWGRS